jgi:hypothetical protein
MLILKPFGCHARRGKRIAAGVLTLAFVASNAFAAMGVCVAKAPVRAALQPLAAEAPCPQHVVDASVPAGESGATHCPQDDPGAQPRTADLPVGDWIAAPAFTRLDVAPGLGFKMRAVERNESPPAPLYARLSRLLL